MSDLVPGTIPLQLQWLSGHPVNPSNSKFTFVFFSHRSLQEVSDFNASDISSSISFHALVFPAFGRFSLGLDYTLPETSWILIAGLSFDGGSVCLSGWYCGYDPDLILTGWNYGE